MRRDREIVFELPPLSVVEQVHAGIDVLILHSGIGGNVGVPLAGIIAEEVVAGAGQDIQADDIGAGFAPTS